MIDLVTTRLPAITTSALRKLAGISSDPLLPFDLNRYYLFIIAVGVMDVRAFYAKGLVEKPNGVRSIKRVPLKLYGTLKNPQNLSFPVAVTPVTVLDGFE